MSAIQVLELLGITLLLVGLVLAYADLKKRQGLLQKKLDAVMQKLIDIKNR